MFLLLSVYCLDTKKKISSSNEVDRKAKTEYNFKMTNVWLGCWDEEDILFSKIPTEVRPRKRRSTIKVTQ